MCHVSDINFPLIRPEVPYYIFGAEAISHCSDPLTAVFGAHLDETGVDDWVDGWWEMAAFVGIGVFAFEPFLDVEVAGPVEGNGIAVEDIRHYNELDVVGKVSEGGSKFCDKYGPDTVLANSR